MEELTGFGMKNSLTLPSSANKFFNSLRDENDQPIYTYTDSFMRIFVHVKQLKLVDVILLTNIKNLKFRMKFLILFQKN